jgi:uncharacterized circularly permuted ATP-grasp superfamily protein/uncharacterized alpha-E superfamily protein
MPLSPAAHQLRDQYCAEAGTGDVLCAASDSDAAAWQAAFEELIAAGQGDLAVVRDRIQHQVNDIGTSFRLANESEERQWPVSPIPLLIAERDWRPIADAVIQRAELAELVLADIYGPQRLIASGMLPAAALTGSLHYLRSMVGVKPVGGHYLNVFACDLGRGPDGDWRVLSDHTRSPAGAGYALENRIAVSQVATGLASRLNVKRLAPFFADLRAGLAAACNRSDPRLALLTPGRYNQSYAEQAHLARYLGLLLVEGADLAVHDGRLYLRTIEGLKRVDALWQRMDARLLDPLSLDSRSSIGVPGLVEALDAGEIAVLNFPGSAVLEAPVFGAFLPKLAQRLLGAPLLMPNIATWWCGQLREANHVRGALDSLVIAGAFGAEPIGLAPFTERMGQEIAGDDRARLLADLDRRPQDYIGQEVVRLSTMPVLDGQSLQARPFTLRVFAARGAGGNWTIMSGGFVRTGPVADVRATSIGAGVRSADVVIFGDTAVPPASLLPGNQPVAIRRNPGTLPSRVADNLFWLGRYLERAEAILALVRVGSAGTLESRAGGISASDTTLHICDHLVADEAVIDTPDASAADIFRAAVGDMSASSSVASLVAACRGIGAGSRERLSPDFWRLLDMAFPTDGSFQEQNLRLKARFAALAGLAAENMGRTAGWRFLDLGRRIERAIALTRLIGDFAGEDASGEDLLALLDLCDAQISYRQRYATGLALLPVRDLVGLDPFNPRSICFQIDAIVRHLGALPRLGDDGMAEEQERLAAALAAQMAMLTAEALTQETTLEIEMQLARLSDSIGQRFFLRSGKALRASGMTLA